MFKSKEVGPNNEVLVPAPMDHLDPVKEHRFFCPWKNPETQRWNNAKSPDEDLPAWRVLAQVLKNDAYLRGALDNRPKSRARSGTGKGASNGGDHRQPSTPGRPSTPTTPVGRGIASLDGSSSAVSFAEGDEEEDEKARDAKDKERWARLRRVKSLFETKGGKRLRRTLSRPGTGHSNRSGLSTSEAA